MRARWVAARCQQRHQQIQRQQSAELPLNGYYQQSSGVLIHNASLYAN